MSARAALLPLFVLVGLAWAGLLIGQAPLGGRAITSVAALGGAWVKDANGATPCPPVGQGFDCGPHGWHRVEPRDVLVRGKNERCVWVHPQQGRTVFITTPTPAGDAGKTTKLKVSFALDDRAVGGGAPVEVVVSRGDATLKHTHEDRAGWRLVDAPGRPGELLTLAISSAHEGRRHFCFRLEGAATLP